MKKFSLSILAFVFLASSGCSLLDFGEDKAQEYVRVVPIIAKSMEDAEPIIQGIEAATGPVITDGQQQKGENAASTIQTVANLGGGIANAIPGGQGVGTILFGIGTLAGAVSTFISRRKTKKVTRAAVAAADSLSGGGKALTEAAKANGVADTVHAEYVATKK